MAVARPSSRPLALGCLVLVVVVGACTAGEPAAEQSATPTGPAPTTAASLTPTPVPAPTATRTPTPSLKPTPSPNPTPTQRVGPATPSTAAMLATVESLAGDIGPREATSAAFREAARLVQRRLTEAGYAVRTQSFAVPAGVSWGVAVRAGRSSNVIATPPGFDRSRPHLVVGAHLDTVPQAPGAEDNASGVAALLEVARLAAERPPAVPVVLVAFGAEEPRGPGDRLHHFGSRVYVTRMAPEERAALVGMLSLDRVGVGRRVPVCTGGLGTEAFARQVRAAAQAVDVATDACSDNRASDHWSFEKAGLPSARLGSVGYAAYHSPADLPPVVDPDQLTRSALVAWSTVRRAAAR